MTVTDLIADDHRAAREIFATAGNAPQQGDAVRLAEMERLKALWDAHNAMMDRLVYPLVERVRAELAQEGRGRQERAAALLADLAARADAEAGIEGDWLAGLHRLKELFERQAQHEEAQVVPAILQGLPPAEIGRLTHDAARLRAAGGA
jgi:hypothetical protein